MVANTARAVLAKSVEKVVAVNVGRSQILGSAAEVTVAQPKQVNLRAGQAIQLRLPYEFKERQTDKDHWSFTLETMLGRLFSEETPTRQKPVSVMFGDRWGRYDARRGILEQTLVIQRPGDYSIAFEVEAYYARMPWGDYRIQHSDRRTGSGQVRVHLSE